MIKFTIGLGIFSRPYMWKKFGPNNALMVDILITLFTIFSNINLVKCMNIMPWHMVTPDSNLTYGIIVEYILDDRHKRMKSGSKSHWKYVLDFVIFFS
jgi:hypothetical protein